MFKKILAILMMCVLLCGCSLGDIEEKLPKKTFSEGDISIELPSTFKNFSKQKMAEGKDFLFAGNEIGIAGVKDTKKEIEEMFGEKDAEGYANLIAELNELNTTASKKNGHWSFTYEDEVDGKEYTYLCVIHETSTAFWNIQVYCETDKYEENEDTMWDYATEIEIADNGDKEEEEDPTEEEPTEEEPTEEEPTEEEPTEEEPTEAEPTEAGQTLITLDLPEEFEDYSEEDVGAGYSCIYGTEEIMIVVLQENKEELYAYFGELDLEGYADLIAELYGDGNTAEEKDGFWNLVYTDDSTGVSYTYDAAFYETEADFWFVQAFCLTEQYEELADDIWQYITSAEFAEN